MERKGGTVGVARRMTLAILASGLGWITASVLLALYSGVAGYLTLRAHGDAALWHPWRSFLAPTFSFSVFTGLFTLLVVLVFILPYVSLRSAESILERPWRMYLDPLILGFVCITFFDLYTHPTAYTVRQYFPMQVGYMAIAAVTSLCSSSYFLRLLRKTAISSPQG